MKRLIYLITFLILTLTSCFVKRYYIDVPYTSTRIFQTYPFELYSCAACQNNYDDYVAWNIQDNRITGIPFRQNEYLDSAFLLKAHNTLKSIGYRKIISNSFYKQHIRGFIDSILYFNATGFDSTNYYSMFLFRREVQGTKSVSVKILSEIKEIFEGNLVSRSNEPTNDTIVRLINLDYQLKLRDGIEKKQVLFEIYNYLIFIKQYHIAYQVMNRPIDFTEFGFSKDSALLTFPLDTVKESSFSDSTIRLGNFNKAGEWADSYLWWKDYPGP